ncbi:MAG: RNA methyltransferase, partial [Oscillospiraceae bacterium]|nr:RNA methyltransferase [Oscillospiraceae bacterium]
MEKITSRRNKCVIHAKKLSESKSYRAEHKQFICDGEKLFNEAVLSNTNIQSVFVTDENRQAEISNTNIYFITQDLLNYISSQKNPQGMLFICNMPETAPVDLKIGTHILLDNVQDPGNVGTIIRSANAFGIDSVILTGETADLYNPKTIRASMGAIFKQKVLYLTYDELKQSGARYIGTTSNKEAHSLLDFNLSNSVIVFGSEGQGISKTVEKLCTEMINIPLDDNVESLNVATAATIIMWE